VERAIQSTRQVDADSSATVPNVADLEALRPRLFALAQTLVVDDGEAEDLVQSTFEIAIHRLSQLRRADSLWSWLVVIETHEAFRLRRRLRRLTRLTTESIQEAAPDSQSTAEIRDALSHLTPRVRAAVALHYMADLTVRETARAMGVSENTVKTQLKTGLDKLKEWMK
jgi:RNA polymerase sigma factor (sigma-70 family)